MGGAVVGRRGNRGSQDEATGGRRRHFDVFAIGSDVADVREGEGDDLARVRGVRQDLLIAGDRGIEADFPYCRPVGADTAAPKYRSVREDERFVLDWAEESGGQIFHGSPGAAAVFTGSAGSGPLAG